MARRAIFAVVHAVLLVMPALALGRIAEAARPRALAIVVLLLVLAALESKTVDRPKSDGEKLALLSSMGLLSTAWLAIAEHGTTALLPWLGLALGVAGVALRAAAIRALGAGFSSAIEPGPVLVVRGIYGHVRHPSDLGLLLLTGGIALLGESLLAGLAGVAVGASIAARIGREEAALSERFQEVHGVYRQRVRALLPSMASARLRC